MTKKKPTAKKPAAKKARKKAPTVKAVAALAGVRVEDAKAILNNGLKNGGAFSDAMVSLVLGAQAELSK